jgi:hypothetical protein
MSSLGDLPELVGFFSYSREDDKDAHGALSALRQRIQGDLRSQLGRPAATFRIWQDKEAVPSGTLWETEINNAVAQSVFFIPIVTPTVVRSPHCQFELNAFLAREAALGRSDLVFPILYIDVPALQDSARRQNDPIISVIARRQYVDWRELRHHDVDSRDVKEAVGRFCRHIRDAIERPWLSPEEKAKAERVEEEARQRTAEQERQKREAEAERARIAALEAKAREEEAERQRQEELEQQRAEAARRRAEEGRLREEADAIAGTLPEKAGNVDTATTTPQPAAKSAGSIVGWTVVIAVVAAGAWWWGGWHALLAAGWIVIFLVIWGQMTEGHSNPVVFWIVFPVVTVVALGLWNWLAKPELRYDACIPNPFARVAVCTTSPFIRPSQPGKP